MAVTLTISVDQNSQSTTNNTSNVTVTVRASWTYGSHNLLEKSGLLTIDGVSYSFTSPFNTGQTTSGVCILYTKTVNVSHNSDGTKTLSVSAKYNTGVSSGTIAAAAKVTLTTIPRKSSLSASNGTLGTAQTLTVSRKSSSYTHTITYKCGSASGTVCTKSGSTSISWTPPLSLASQNATGTSVSISFTITTYSGSSSIGSNTKTITCAIPSSVKPTVKSVTVSDPTGYATKYGGYIKGKSKLKVVVSASGSYSSTIESYKTTADGKSYIDSTFTTPVVSGTGSLKISTTVTDSRNRTATGSATVTSLAYSTPKISTLTTKRCNLNGDTNPSGAYIAVSFTASVTSLNSKNSAVYAIGYKKTTEQTYTMITAESGDARFNYDGQYSISGSYIFAADTASSYQVTFTAADDFGSSTKSAAASSASKLFSILAKGKGFAIGKVAELSGYLDVAFDALFRKNINILNNNGIFGLNPIDNEYRDCFKPQNENGNTVLGWGNYDKENGNTNVYGHDVNIGVSNIASKGYYRPYRRQGDTVTLSVRTAGYVTNGGKDVSFCIPLSVPIVGSPTVTITSGTGFALRQGNNYTHGSSASVSVNPDSYEVVSYMFNGIYVKAVFSDTTNVTNNDAIGVYWNGTITFS